MIQPGEKTVVYTSHSIEQIQTLKADVILGLLDRGREVSGLHLESPVGDAGRKAYHDRALHTGHHPVGVQPLELDPMGEATGDGRA